METFLSFVALAAACAAAVVVLAELPRLRLTLASSARAVVRPFVSICGFASRSADFFLSPREGVTAWWRFPVWFAAGLVPLAICTAVARASLAHVPHSVLPYFAAVLAAAGLFQVLVLGAALVIVSEDGDVMDHLIGEDGRRIGGARTAKRLPAVAVSVALCLVYAVALAWWLNEVSGVDLFVKRPDSGVAVVDYLLVVLWSLPTSLVLAPIDWLLGVDTQASFAMTLVARGYYFAVYAIGTLLLASSAVVLFHLRRQTRRCVVELGEGREGERDRLIERARRAPLQVRRRIVNAALVGSDRKQQMRLIEAARDSAMLSFPPMLCRHLHTCDEDVAQFALERALELYRQRVADFGRDPCEAMVRSGARHLERGELGTETQKRLVRLMFAVLSTKRDVVRPDGAVKKRILDAIEREMKKPREQSDPAFRGLLQDLRVAIVRVGEPKSAAPPSNPDHDDWIKQLMPAPARRAERRGSPARTALQ